ncbi:hypothetical protein C0J52_10675 [Blattella germanica]|nr:hypothetical protein C0J52_10675 [Blattella germanica]
MEMGINLARGRKLATAESTVLAKGGDFAVMPTTIPVEDIISNVEACTCDEIHSEDFLLHQAFKEQPIPSRGDSSELK